MFIKGDKITINVPVHDLDREQKKTFLGREFMVYQTVSNKEHDLRVFDTSTFQKYAICSKYFWYSSGRRVLTEVVRCDV